MLRVHGFLRIRLGSQHPGYKYRFRSRSEARGLQEILHERALQPSHQQSVATRHDR